jgi:pimeloyl-ACP methyl ester carboxylesterase
VITDGAEIQTEGLRDIDVAYRSVGEGPRTVLLHGLAQDHRMWAAQQRDLAGAWTFAYDLRGHGRTTLGDADGTLPQLGQDLIAFLERFGPAHCVGFSLGGTVALWAAAERPDLMASVVAVATSSVVGRRAAAGVQERIELFEQNGAEAMRKVLLEDTRRQLARGTATAEEIVDARMEAIGDGRGYVNGARAMAWMHEHPLNDALARIELPVLVVAGESDVVCPPRAAEIMLEHLRSVEYEELAGGGHLITDEDPDALTRILRSWLERKGND